jgi:hypothetical protein
MGKKKVAGLAQVKYGLDIYFGKGNATGRKAGESYSKFESGVQSPLA